MGKRATIKQLDLFIAATADDISSGVAVERMSMTSAPVATPEEPVKAARPRPANDVEIQKTRAAGPARQQKQAGANLAGSVTDFADDKRLFDVREAAARLGLSKSTLDKMRCTGQGPRFIRATGRAVRYDPADLKAFAESRRQGSTSETLPPARR